MADTAPTITKAAISKAAADWSVEITPAAADRIPDFASLLAPGTKVNIAAIRGRPFDAVMATARLLHAAGMHPVPHIPARRMDSAGRLRELLAPPAADGVLREVLVIGGDADEPEGAFPSSMALLQSGVLQELGVSRIGVAGHPEGAPHIGADALAEALAGKNAFARDCGMEVYIITQFCFDPAAVIAWEAAIRRAGNTLPIRIGIPGPATIKSLVQFAAASGVGASARMVKKYSRNITRLLTVQAPDALVAGLAAPIAAEPESMLAGFHYYPFGGFARTCRWAQAVAQGDFTMHDDGAGFTVQED